MYKKFVNLTIRNLLYELAEANLMKMPMIKKYK